MPPPRVPITASFYPIQIDGSVSYLTVLCTRLLSKKVGRRSLPGSTPTLQIVGAVVRNDNSKSDNSAEYDNRPCIPPCLVKAVTVNGLYERQFCLKPKRKPGHLTQS